MNRTLSLLAFAVLVLSLVGLILRQAILADWPVGAPVQAMAVVLMIWARVTFGTRSFHASAEPTEGGLVTTGPYRFLRHPIYASIFYFLWAAVLSHVSVANIALGVAGTAGIGVRIAAEEKLLLARYPEYAAYAARTKRLIPFLF